MPAELALPEVAVHASAVAIDGRALLIRGPSRSGKSRLAAALVDASTRRRPIVLIGDDRIILRRAAGRIFASPHPRIAGFIERRGLGIVAMPFVEAAPVHAIVDLAERIAYDNMPTNFPALRIVMETGAEAARVVLDWWDASATCASHPPRKAATGPGRPQKIRIGNKPG